jgi:hypothetical protein
MDVIDQQTLMQEIWNELVLYIGMKHAEKQEERALIEDARLHSQEGCCT